LAVPKGFAFTGTGSSRLVATAVLTEGGKPVQSVTLAVRPEEAESTAAALADHVRQETAEALNVRNLTVVKDWPLTVAGTAGVARRVTYVSRGEKMTATMACFVRLLEDGKSAIGYVLTVSSVAEKEGTLGAVYEAVAGSIVLTPIRRPTELPIETLAEAIASPSGQYSLRRPHGWYAVGVGGSVTVAQADCLLDAETVRAWVVVHPVAKGTSARQQAQGLMGMKVPRVRRTVVSQGPAAMGGREGYQFTVKLSPDAPAASSRPATAPAEAAVSPLVVQRILCLPGPDGKAERCYSLFLFYQGPDVQAAQAMMDKIAEGFSLTAPAGK
jgi:hypothetical protein